MTPKRRQNLTFNKVTTVPYKSISQYTLTTWDALHYVHFHGKMHLNAVILKSNFSKLLYL